MATIRINNISFEAQAIVFDKDGTLIDFFAFWKRRIKACVKRLITMVEGKGKDSNLTHALYLSLGYDFESDAFAGDGPLATASISRLHTIAAAVSNCFRTLRRHCG